MSAADVEIIRDLTGQYADICSDPRQDQRRRLWRDHNSVSFSRPPIYVRARGHGAIPATGRQCGDSLSRGRERVRIVRELIEESRF